MNHDLIPETALIRDVEEARTRFTSTQELYREVCGLLFFRYGITPTANKLYQLVKKGSMSAPAQALTTFWDELRTKSRTKIEHPDLPEELGTLAGELLAEIWHRSQALAGDSLEAYRKEADAAVEGAKAEVTALLSSHDEQVRTIQSLQVSLTRANETIATQREEIHAANHERTSLLEMLEGAKRDNREFQQQLENARMEFSAELDKLHAAAKLTEERARATENRWLLEIDRERINASKLQKKIEAQQEELTKLEQQRKIETTQAQMQASEYQQEIALLKGTLNAVTMNLERAESELHVLRTQVAKSAVSPSQRDMQGQITNRRHRLIQKRSMLLKRQNTTSNT